VTERTRDMATESEALTASELKYRGLVDNAPIGILIHHGGSIRFINPAGIFILGVKRAGDAVGKALADFVKAEDHARVTGLVRDLRRGSVMLPVEVRLPQLDGSEFWVEVHAAPVEYEGRLAALVMIVDIDAHKKAEEELNWLSYYDKLTGLPNRRLFMDRIIRAIAMARRGKHEISLILLDPRHIGHVNDSLGRKAGDSVLREIGARITQVLRDSDTVAHLDNDYTVAHMDGDEFAILLPETDIHGAMHVVRRISERLGEACEYEGQEIVVASSFGIAEFPRDAGDVDDLLKHAGIALSNAKAGKHEIGFFSKDMESKAEHRLRLENDLSRALENGELTLYYQPQHALAGKARSLSPPSQGGRPAACGDVIGVECLLRWRHPKLGMVSPAEFIPVAEESGLITPITHWVLAQACRQALAWERAGIRPGLIGVNISAAQLIRKGLAEEILSRIRNAGANPEWIGIEITETVAMREPETAIGIMRKLADAGVSVAIDDFGTGYSSLAYLKRLSAEWLKIDIAFIRGLPDDGEDAAIVRSTIAMAHALNLRTIAEGVETRAQLEFLRSEGCDAAQGFLFSKPLTVEDMDAYLRKMRK